MCSCDCFLVFLSLTVPFSFYSVFYELEYFLLYKGYKLESIAESEGEYIRGNLVYQGSSAFYNTNQSMIYRNLSLKIEFEADDEFSVLITDANNTRFSLPYEFPFPFTKKREARNETLYEIQYEIDDFFHFKVIRKQTQEVIFNSKDHHLIFSDRYIEYGTYLPSSHIYGLGERRRAFHMEPGTYTIWPLDQSEIDSDGSPGYQTYGHHPVYLAMEKSRNYHVVFFRTTSAMDVVYTGKSLIYKVVGGRIELKFFLGDQKPDTAISLYHKYINGFGLMPFWAFGFHQSRWGYNQSSDFTKVADKFEEFKLPIDALWLDIDYMDRFMDFTVDNENFLLADLKKVKQRDLKLVLIIDFGIEYCNNSACKQGLEKNIFIKSDYTNATLLNTAWPFLIAFPDFNNPNITDFWTENLKALRNSTGFDGIWLDMNEPSALIDGEIIDPIFIEELKNKSHSTVIFPYHPGRKNLNYKTISPDAYHENHGIFIDQNSSLRELDFHSLNGFAEAKTTYDSLKALGHELPFVISRSNTFGSGKFSGHWTGDNRATWTDMKISISSIFNHQIFGIPFVGADVCGFFNDTNEELCARWMQLGAFYPFFRNHNSLEARSQEPFSWGKSSIVFKASMASLKLRYSLLKYYYSLFLRANGTGTIFRPLFFEFYEDDRAQAIEEQFLIGSDILVAPVLTQDVSEIKVYIPYNSNFYCYYCGRKFNPPRWHKVPALISDTVPLFIKEGAVVFTNYVDRVQRTKELDNYYILKIALKEISRYRSYEFYEARGSILAIKNLDDRNVINKCTLKRCLIDLEVTVMKRRLTLETNIAQIELNFAMDSDVEVEEVFINQLDFYGLTTKKGYEIFKYEFPAPYQIRINDRKRILVDIPRSVPDS